VTAPESAESTRCVVQDCTYPTEADSSYCTLHGVKWGRGGPAPEPTPDSRSAQMLADFRKRHAHPPRLGCGLVAHRDLGFCSACHKHGSSGEITGWRLLAMAERGIPNQPWEDR
jgi:hypothetical protein